MSTSVMERVFFGHHEVDPRALLYYEWCQRRESGYAVADYEQDVWELTHSERPVPAVCRRLLDRIEAAPRVADWPYPEWDDTSELVVPEADSVSWPPRPPSAELSDRVHGGWLGRCVGCTLGRPFENGFLWTPERIREYLESAGAYPLLDYVPAGERLPHEAGVRRSWRTALRGRIDGCPPDDAIDYTVLGLHLLEQRGPRFTTADVAELWLERLPFLQTYTAERVAYRNLIDGFPPPATATFRNPYREWVGALGRADIHGYVHPGDPYRAAASVARDAALSHVGNGLWAAMWAAALVAAAFTAPDTKTALAVALSVVPARSRLAVALAEVTAEHDRCRTWDEAVAAVHARHGHYNWVHSIGNACLIAAGLLWGAGDFTTTITLAVQGGWSTDVNGATAGSVAGILTGASAIPAHWTTPLRDTLHSSVAGYDGVRISNLAKRTISLTY